MLSNASSDRQAHAVLIVPAARSVAVARVLIAVRGTIDCLAGCVGAAIAVGAVDVTVAIVVLAVAARTCFRRRRQAAVGGAGTEVFAGVAVQITADRRSAAVERAVATAFRTFAGEIAAAGAGRRALRDFSAAITGRRTSRVATADRVGSAEATAEAVVRVAALAAVAVGGTGHAVFAVASFADTVAAGRTDRERRAVGSTGVAVLTSFTGAVAARWWDDRAGGSLRRVAAFAACVGRAHHIVVSHAVDQAGVGVAGRADVGGHGGVGTAWCARPVDAISRCSSGGTPAQGDLSVARTTNKVVRSGRSGYVVDLKNVGASFFVGHQDIARRQEGVEIPCAVVVAGDRFLEVAIAIRVAPGFVFTDFHWVGRIRNIEDTKASFVVATHQITAPHLAIVDASVVCRIAGPLKGGDCNRIGWVGNIVDRDVVDVEFVKAEEVLRVLAEPGAVGIAARNRRGLADQTR